MAYLVAKRKSVSTTPQTQPISRDQVKNQAGGYVFALDEWKALDRFLILGCEGPTYYASQQKQLDGARDLIRSTASGDPQRFAKRIADIAGANRAPKMDPLLYALAVGAASTSNPSPIYDVLPRVATTATHLFHFFAMSLAERGAGSGLRRAVRAWYDGKSDADLAYQAIKYQQRDGWSHRDVLRLTHPKADGVRNDIYRWMVKGWDDIGDEVHPNEVLARIWGFEKMKRASSAEEAAALVRQFNLPRECVKTEFLSSALVWEALLERMPFMAMVRNLGNMTKTGLLAPNSVAAQNVYRLLKDDERIRASRLHPIQFLSALSTYANGCGAKGKGEWVPVQAISSALDYAVTRSFDYVEPTGKRFYLAVDVSPSMHSGEIAGIPNLSPAAASAVLALAIAKAEAPNYVIRGFSSMEGNYRQSPFGYGVFGYGSGVSLKQLAINDGSSVADARRAVKDKPWGGTDCALPMMDAMAEGLPVDVFVVITDNETHSGTKHPMVALKEYRAKTGIDAKLVVIGMTSTGFTIADPKDKGCLDIVGFDAATPRLLADFACNRI